MAFGKSRQRICNRSQFIHKVPHMLRTIDGMGRLREKREMYVNIGGIFYSDTSLESVHWFLPKKSTLRIAKGCRDERPCMLLKRDVASNGLPSL